MDKDTLLFRQVHPSWTIGEVFSQLTFTSQTFKPTPKDEGLLSVYNGEIFEAHEAYEHYTEMGLQSCGVVAVSCNECEEAPVPVIEDNEPFEGHCSLDYRGMSGNGIKKTASVLKDFASKRGWIHKVDTK
ncbi:MAG: hypothetical protein MUE75_15140 [Algoriphagus sp.]|jgi:hypothetical protein|nr:hypothetical protein [Algoriphagus sp.]